MEKHLRAHPKIASAFIIAFIVLAIGFKNDILDYIGLVCLLVAGGIMLHSMYVFERQRKKKNPNIIEGNHPLLTNRKANYIFEEDRLLIQTPMEEYIIFYSKIQNISFEENTSKLDRLMVTTDPILLVEIKDSSSLKIITSKERSERLLKALARHGLHTPS